jgi:hypothetical protein
VVIPKAFWTALAGLSLLIKTFFIFSQFLFYSRKKEGEKTTKYNLVFNLINSIQKPQILIKSLGFKVLNIIAGQDAIWNSYNQFVDDLTTELHRGYEPFTRTKIITC